MILSTTSYQLAIHAEGDTNAPKLALVLPGRLDTKDYAHVRSHITYLASRGFYAVSFDPPGTWESPGDIDLYTTTNYLQAIREVVVHFGSRPTLFMGHSRGGSMAMLAGATCPQATGIIAVMSRTAPSTPKEECYRQGYQLESRDLSPGTVITERQKEFTLPLAYFEDTATYDFLTPLQTCPLPKLLFAGLHDTIVSAATIKEQFATLAEPKTLHDLDSGHDYRQSAATIDEVNHVIGDFLQAYNL